MELLAVIVILAIIALIAVPQILNLINDSKEKSVKISAQNYLRAVEVAVMNKDTDIETKNLNGTYKIEDNGKQIVSENNTIDIEFDGQGITEGYLTITGYKVSSLDMKIDKHSIRLIDGEIVLFEEKEIEKSVLVKGQEFNSIIKSLVNGSNTAYSFVDENVISIDFYSNGLLPSGHTKETLELLPKANISINNDATAYNDNGKIYIISDKLISFNSSSDDMFSKFSFLESIKFRNIDTTNLTSMVNMFGECGKLNSVDVEKMDTSNVTNMSSVFYKCSSIENLNIGKWKTDNVTSMSWIFRECKSLTNIDVSNWKTDNVTNMSHMFYFCNNVLTLDVSNWDTSNVTSFDNMFNGCKKVETIDVSKWNTENATTLSLMFYNCNNVKKLDLSNWNTEKVKNMSQMFNGCNQITTINFGENFKTNNITSMSFMFMNCNNLKELDLRYWDTSQVTNMSYMFCNCKLLTSLDIRNFDTNFVTNMNYIFSGTINLKPIYVGENWFVTDSINETNMFTGSAKTKNLEQLCYPNSTHEWCVVSN